MCIPIKIITFLILALTISSEANATDILCDTFTDTYEIVNAKSKAYFHAAPTSHPQKSYLVNGDVVQIGQSQNGFTCARYEGKKDRVSVFTTGWLRNSELRDIPSFTEQSFEGKWGQMDFPNYWLEIYKKNGQWYVEGRGMNGLFPRSDCDFQSKTVEVKDHTLVVTAAESMDSDGNKGKPQYTISYVHGRLQVAFSAAKLNEQARVCGDHGTLQGLYHRARFKN